MIKKADQRILRGHAGDTTARFFALCPELAAAEVRRRTSGLFRWPTWSRPPAG